MFVNTVRCVRFHGSGSSFQLFEPAPLLTETQIGEVAVRKGEDHPLTRARYGRALGTSDQRFLTRPTEPGRHRNEPQEGNNEIDLHSLRYKEAPPDGSK